MPVVLPAGEMLQPSDNMQLRGLCPFLETAGGKVSNLFNKAQQRDSRHNYGGSGELPREIIFDQVNDHIKEITIKLYAHSWVWVHYGNRSYGTTRERCYAAPGCTNHHCNGSTNIPARTGFVVPHVDATLRAGVLCNI